MKAEARSVRAGRVDRMLSEPWEVRGLLGRFVGSVLRVFGWQARFSTAALEALLDGLGENPSQLALLFATATEELDDNLTVAERACSAFGYVPTAHASWLYRVIEVLAAIELLVSAPDATARRGLLHLDRGRVLAPLRLDEVATAQAAERQVVVPSTEPEVHQPRVTPDRGARLLSLQLAAIDQVLEAARGETRFLARRRRLFEGARRLLLDASAALPLATDGVIARQTLMTHEITRLDRLEASGVLPTVDVRYQARQAARRGDRERLYASLVAIDGLALARGDHKLASSASRALDRLSEGAHSVTLPQTLPEGEVRAAASRLFGPELVSLVDARYAARREDAGLAAGDPELHQLALSYLAPGSEEAALSALTSVDGRFEVGSALSPVRARESEEFARLSSLPTPEMVLVQAQGPFEVQNAVIDDPRTLLLDLASGRLLSRRFIERGRREVVRTRLVGEVRVYLLDASTSMLEDGKDGARARVRDAILLAELATVMRRLSDASRGVRLSLYYRFFTKRLGPLVRVASAAEALAAMGEVVGEVRKGGTNIEGALLSSLELVREEKQRDPELARASIVLVTDGDSAVDAEAVRRAREQAKLPIAVSVIALGQENLVLRELVAHQRRRGERVFYQFVDDQQLLGLCEGQALRGSSIVAPQPSSSEDLAACVADILVELEDLELAERTGGSSATGLGHAAPRLDGALAQDEATLRDRQALDRRFERWFPPASEASAVAQPATVAGEPTSPSSDNDDLDATRVVLATVAEVVAELGGDRWQRKADAIDLIERLLPDAWLTAQRYREVLRRSPERLRLELAAISAAVAGAEASFAHRLAQPR